MRLFLLILFTALFFSSIKLPAQVKFSATASATEIGKNEMLQIRFVVENAASVEQIKSGSFSNFTIISGPNQESGMTSINGSIKQYIAISFILQPKAVGTFTIPAAKALADGKEYSSNTVSVKVSNSTAPGSGSGGNNINVMPGFNLFDDAPVQTPFNDYILKKGEKVADKISRNMFVKLQTDKTTCYVGEPITATYKLYTRLKSESNVIKNPSFNGFSVIDLQEPGSMYEQRETVNGRQYNVYTLRQVQLYPLQPGTVMLEAVEVENNIQFIKEEYAAESRDMLGDVFSGFVDAGIPAEGIATEKIILQNKPVAITVKTLPEENMPAAFKGAVGKFTIKDAIEKNTFTTDDAGQLNVIIEGKGNLQLVTLPDVKWPDGIEAFEPTVKEDVDKSTLPLSGRKILSWNFTATEPGNIVLPPVTFCYFDPGLKKYVTDSTKPITFTVTKGVGKKQIPIVAEEKKKSLLNSFFSNRRRVVSAVAILILLGLIFWLKKDKRKETEKATQEILQEEPEPVLVKEEKNYLEKAGEELNGDSISFYKELNAAVKNYLADKLNMPAATLNKKIIIEGLDKKNVSLDTLIQLQNLLNNIELQLYAPFAEQEKKQQLYNEVEEIMQLLALK